MPAVQLSGVENSAVAVLWSFAGFGSRSFPRTVAVLERIPVVPAATVPLTVIVAEAPAASGPRTQVSCPDAIAHPGVLVVAPLSAAGRGSVTTYPVDPTAL